MNLKETISQQFRRTLSSAEINSELKLVLKNHQKSKDLIRQLTDQLSKVIDLRKKQNKSPPTPKSIKDITHDMTMMYIKNVTKYFDQRQASDLQRLLLKQKQDHAQDLDLASDGTYKGDFEELKILSTSDERDL